MAGVIVNPVLKKIHGKIGGLVFKKYGDETIIAQSPGPRTTPPTAGQQAQRERFKLAAVYGHTALADPVTGAIYRDRAKAKGQPVFSVAVADFFHPPVVDAIDLSAYTGKTGETIKIRASDDFEVVGVEVRILDVNGTALEQGPATRSGSDGQWLYPTTTNLPDGQQVSIEVTATDRPGHKGTKTQTRG